MSSATVGERLNILRRINLVFVIALGTIAGIVKVIRLPMEVEFFEYARLGGNSVVVFGVVQLVGSVLLVFPRTRFWGASVVAATFLSVTVMLFAAGLATFGVVSVLPVAMVGIIVKENARKGPQASGSSSRSGT